MTFLLIVLLDLLFVWLPMMFLVFSVWSLVWVSYLRTLRLNGLFKMQKTLMLM
jgi:hypothetical protein